MNTIFKPIIQHHDKVSSLLDTLPKGDSQDAIHIQALNPKHIGNGEQDIVVLCDAVGYTDALINAFKGFCGLFTHHVPLTALEAISEINRTVKPGALYFTLLPIDATTIDQQEFIETLHATAINSRTRNLQLVTVDYLTTLNDTDKAFLFKSNA